MNRTPGASGLNMLNFAIITEKKKKEKKAQSSKNSRETSKKLKTLLIDENVSRRCLGDLRLATKLSQGVMYCT